MNFTVYDFGVWQNEGNSASNAGQSCDSSIRIHETATGEETIICGGDQRITHPYTSKTNIVDVSFIVESAVDVRTELLLKYEGTFGKLCQLHPCV